MTRWNSPRGTPRTDLHAQLIVVVLVNRFRPRCRSINHYPAPDKVNRNAHTRSRYTLTYLTYYLPYLKHLLAARPLLEGYEICMLYNNVFIVVYFSRVSRCRRNNGLHAVAAATTHGIVYTLIRLLTRHTELSTAPTRPLGYYSVRLLYAYTSIRGSITRFTRYVVVIIIIKTFFFKFI